MSKAIFTLVFGMMSLFGYAQEQFVLSLDEFQVIEDPQTLIESQARFPGKDMAITLGGLNDLKGIGNYFDAFGTKLLIDDMQTTYDGGHSIILRREDGRNFYNLFPTLRAKLIPLTHQEKKDALAP